MPTNWLAYGTSTAYHTNWATYNAANTNTIYWNFARPTVGQDGGYGNYARATPCACGHRNDHHWEHTEEGCTWLTPA